jgi:hypothetical protein
MFLIGQAAAQSCPGGMGKTQSGDNNYVVDTFTGSLLFSYAINTCTGGSLIDSTVSYMYTCSKDNDDVWWVTKSSYASADCSGSATVVDTWDDSETMEGGLGYFKCDGKNNYAKITIGLDPTCTVTTSIAGGLGGCAANPSFDPPLDNKFYCDSSSAIVFLYVNPSAVPNATYEMCDDAHLCNQWVFGSSCALSAQFLGNDVYGKMESCTMVTDGGDSSDGGDGDGDEDSSASSQFTLMGIAIALIASLFH